MSWSKIVKGAAVVALLSSAPMQAGAIEIVGGSNPAANINDGLIASVVIVRGPAGGLHGRPGYHPGVHRGYRPGVGYHPGYAGGVYHGWARPSWYHWGAGGAIAAGAALGFLGAAAVASWAPPAPAPGLCWYYTDPSQRQGFWDACP
jgi:hypothetical protein